MAGDMALRDVDLARGRSLAQLGRARAARVEMAARRRRDRVGIGHAKLGVGHAQARLGRQHRFQQRLRIGVARRVEQASHAVLLHDPAQIHDGHPRRQMLDHRQVVADEQVGQAEFALQFAQQVQDLALHRHVQRRGWFVADHHLGLHDQGTRNRHALTLTARHLAGVGVHHPRRQAHHVQYLAHLLCAARLVADPVHAQRQRDDVIDAFARVERGIGILKDRLDHFLDTTPNMPLESSTAWKEFGPLVAKGGINALLDYHWESTLKELLPMIFEDEEALLLRISSALGGEKRTLGAFLPYRSALLLSNIFDERYEEVVNLVDSFLRRRRIRSQIELRGRQLLEDILDRLSRMQRFMLIAGQYDRALREKMPGIVEDALVQLHRGLKEPDVRKGVVKWVRVSLLWARKKEIASLFSLLSGGGIEPGGAFSLLAQELGNSVSSMKVSALFSRFGYDSVQSASETLVSLLFPSGDTEKRGRLSAVFASHPPSRFLRLPPERRDAMATALRTAAITLLERNIKIILDQVDVQTLVVQRVDDLEVEKVEELLLLVIKNHLAYINLFGAILGALIGALQLIISSS